MSHGPDPAGGVVKRLWDSVFAADLAAKMAEHGYTPITLAAKVLNSETGGKQLHSRRIYSYLGQGTRPTNPSPTIWIQLEALMPGLIGVNGNGVLNRGPSDTGCRQKTKRVRIREALVPEPLRPWLCASRFHRPGNISPLPHCPACAAHYASDTSEAAQ